MRTLNQLGIQFLKINKNKVFGNISELMLTKLFPYCRIMWAAGAVAAMGSITYPAISAFVSAHAEADQQGRCFTQAEKVYI